MFLLTSQAVRRNRDTFDAEGSARRTKLSLRLMSLTLVTGGAGFIGSHLVDALIARGGRVRVLDNLSSGKLDNLAAHDPGPVGSGAPVEFLEGDIVDADACGQAMEGVSGVLHEAAQVSVPASIEDPVRSYEVNVHGTQRLLEAARAAGTGRFVMAASSAAYGEAPELPKHEGMVPAPLSPYASGKVAGEHLLRVYGTCYGIKTVALRYFNVFGPRQADDSPYTGVIAIFVRELLQGRTPTIFGDGGQTRDFTFVDNVVAANLAALECEAEPGVLVNVGGAERVSLNDLYKVIAAELGGSPEPGRGPERAGDIRHSLASIDRARDLLGYEPAVRWQDGLRRTLDWYREAAGVGPSS